MQPRIAISRRWSDEHVALLTVEVCDGTSVFSTDAYASLDWGATSAEALQTFSRQVYGGLFNLELGDDGPEYAGGFFRARLHYFTPAALLISTSQEGDFVPFKNTLVAAEARMFLRTEPALLDRFIAALPALDGHAGEAAVLQCISLDAQ